VVNARQSGRITPLADGHKLMHQHITTKPDAGFEFTVS
jgi:hypothetical protein